MKEVREGIFARKFKRKQERLQKKQNKSQRFRYNVEQEEIDTEQKQQEIKIQKEKQKQEKKEKKEKKERKNRKNRKIEEDQETDALDKQIEYLERKLGLRKSKNSKGSEKQDKKIDRNWRKMKKSLETEGFGADFFEFLERKDKHLVEKEPMEENSDNEDYQDEADINPEEEEDMQEYEEDQQEEDFGEEILEEDYEDEESNSESEELSHPPPNPEPEPLKRVKIITEEDRPAINKSLRSVVNRLSDQNIDPLTTQFAQLYSQYSSNTLNELLWDFYKAWFSSVQIPEHLIAVYAASIMGLARHTGKEIIAFIIDCLYKSLDSRNKYQIMYWCYLYLFDAIGSELIVGLIEHFSQLTEENVELLINIFRIAGFKLRKDDPMGLKKVFDLLQESARKVEDPPPRLRFMLDTLLDIKNNKKKLTTEDRIKFLKTWLKKTLTQRLGSTELKLQLTWQDLQTPHWRNLLTPSYKEAKINTTSFSPELEALAKAQHMNSETRKIIFCTIMSAEDYTDAFNKLLKMKKQEREIVRILVTCCGQEQVFNQYYYLLASKFCSYKSSFKYSFQYALWDTLKQLADFSIRKLSNIAKMYGFMISDLMLPLNVFKCINFDEVDSYVSVFLRIALEQIFIRCDTDEISKIFTKIGSSDKYTALSEGLSIFIKQVIAKHPRKAFLVISPQDAIGGAKLLEEKIEVARNCLSIVDN